MATKTLNTRIIIRNDTAANWTSENPVLRKGEIGVVFDPNATDTNAVVDIKIGDGVKAWNALPLIMGVERSRIAALENTIGSSSSGLIKDVADLKTTVGNSSSGLVADVAANTSAIATLNGNESTAGSVAKALKDAKDYADGLAVNYDAAGAASTAAAGALQSAKDYADGLASNYDAAGAAAAVDAKLGAGFDSTNTVAAAVSGLDSRIDALEGNHYLIVNALPTEGQAGYIYLVAINPAAPQDGYKEYIWLANEGSGSSAGVFEQIGTTQIDLSNYYTKADIDDATTGYAKKADVYTKAEIQAAVGYTNNVLGSRIDALEQNALVATDNFILDGGSASTNIN